ncbi:uncharacterized protein LOC135682791 [Rhopilema esculentum]|uniref:uncharacterized protein LOC135682791 n=1 Tax=Rhopilema esculentum TaxID=499914 RepID=UPI0031D79A8E
MSGKVALVTGANRGIGFEICKILCQKLKGTNGTVILTARNEQEGQKACERLTNDGFQAHFMQLDVTSRRSIQNTANKIKEKFNGLDILINNAAYMFSPSKSEGMPYAEQVQKTLEANFFGVLYVYDAMYPLLRPKARAVNVSSRLGSVDILGVQLRKKFCSRNINRNDLLELMNQYLSDVKANKHVGAGWPDYDPSTWLPAAYSVSKLAVTVLTRILANESSIPGFMINCCCPGWCRTNIGGPGAPKSAEEGAADIVDCVFLESEECNGAYFQDGKQQPDILTCQVPMVSLKKVVGFDGKYNDLVFCGEDAMQHVLFFPGDVQNYVEEMEKIKENKAWSDWDLESTAQLLSKRFPKSFIWVVRSALYDRNTFACYSNFIEMDACGTPVFERADSTALSHLKCLLDSAVRKVLDLSPEEEDVTAEFPIVIVGFSKGCMVLNQLAYELPRISISEDSTLSDFVARFDSMYFLDAGNGGQANAYVTDEDVLFHLAQNVPKIRVHVTPYQMKDESRPWIEKEKRKFVAQLKSLGIDIKEKVHFADKKPSLANHFRILTDFKLPLLS